MGASLPSGVWVGVGSSGTGEMVGVSVGAAVGFAVAAGAGVAGGVAVAVGVDVAIGSGVAPEQAARIAMSIRTIGVAWMIVRSTGGFLYLRGVHPPFYPSLITVLSTIVMSPRFAQTGPDWPGTGLVAVFPRHCGQGSVFPWGPSLPRSRSALSWWPGLWPSSVSPWWRSAGMPGWPVLSVPWPCLKRIPSKFQPIDILRLCKKFVVSG